MEGVEGSLDELSVLLEVRRPRSDRRAVVFDVEPPGRGGGTGPGVEGVRVGVGARLIAGIARRVSVASRLVRGRGGVGQVRVQVEAAARPGQLARQARVEVA